MKISIKSLVWLSLILIAIGIITCSIIFNFWRWLVVFYGVNVLLTAHLFHQDTRWQK